MPVLLTIGHSNHPIEHFIGLLKGAGITALADVRSKPYSRRFPHFGREKLASALKDAGIHYVYLGDSLGGHPADASLLTNGHPDYARMREAPHFKAGLDRLLEGAEKYTVAVMCAEREPLECHRTMLIARALADWNVDLRHIMADGTIETHADLEARLLKWAKLGEPELFADCAALMTEAYQKRSAWMWGD